EVAGDVDVVAGGAGRGRRAVGGVVVDGHRLAAGGGQVDVDVDRAEVVVALHSGQVVDRDGGHRVVVDNGALALAVPHGAAGGAGEVDEEGLVGLVVGVAVGQDGEGLARLVGGEGDGARAGLVVGVGRRGGAVGGGVVDGDGRSAWAGQGDGERERRRPGVALSRRHVIDGQDQRVVVQDGALALAVGDEGVAGVGEVDEEGLRVLVERVVGGGDGERLGGLARVEGDGPGAAGVVAGPGRAVGGGEIDRDGLRAGVGERDREGGRAALGDADVVDGQRGDAVIVGDGALALVVGEGG